MKRVVTLLALGLLACEGEPPKVPVGSPPTEAPAVAAEAADAGAGTGAGAEAVAAAPAQATGPCNCAGTDAGAGEGASAIAPTPPVAEAKGTLTGNVTTTPKAAAANAVVYLEDAPIEPTAKMSATVDNHSMAFSPTVQVIPAGGRIVFHNSDPFPHNVFSPDNEKFNMGSIVQNGGAAPRSFKKPGVYTLLCNLHTGMLGWVDVTPSSYYAKADAHGHYTLKDAPAGAHKVTVWAPRQQPVTQTVTIQAGAETTLDFETHR